jgi:hypothetical protein
MSEFAGFVRPKAEGWSTKGLAPFHLTEKNQMVI